jgi:hypothetical protein
MRGVALVALYLALLIVRLFPPYKHFALPNKCTVNSTRLLCVDRQLLLRPHFVPEGNIVCF